MAGIKETKEALIGLNELAIVLAELLKDGAQLSDVSALTMKLVSDENFRQKLDAAREGISLVDDEVKDISVMEAIELAKAQFDYVPKLIEAISK